MKRILLGSTALLGVASLTSGAQASDGVKLDVGGFFNIVFMGVFDQKSDHHFGGHRNTDSINHNAEIHFTGETTLDNGLTVGAHLELEGENSDDQIDQAWVYWSGGFGKVQIGSQDAAIAQFCVLPPGATSNFSAFSPNAWGSNDPIGSNPTCTDVEGNSQKIVYITPSFGGFQLNVSYTPSNNAEDYTQTGVNGPGTPSNTNGTAHQTFGAYATYSYSNDQWGVNWGGGGTWQAEFNRGHGSNSGKSSDYQTALNLTIGDFAAGAVMEFFDNGGSDNDVWIAGGGMSYTMDAFTVGVQGSHGHYNGENLGFDPNPGGSRTLNRVILTGEYAMAPGVTLDAELGYTWFHDSGNDVPDSQDHYHAFDVAVGSAFEF
ncbi:MAG TPA: porin [Candidatus Cybelea sp.]|nr:porin [Candidatus Cybelea sp.]